MLTSGGNVLTWGINTGKQLGDGPGHPRDQWDGLPAAVVGTSGTGVLGDVVAVASGYANSLALLADGRVVIWGDGFNGALGLGQITDSTDSPTPVFVKDGAGTGHLNLGLTSHWPNLTRHAR